jgi:hypothetical protein
MARLRFHALLLALLAALAAQLPAAVRPRDFRGGSARPASRTAHDARSRSAH